MKKYLILVLVFSFFLFGCTRNDISELDINKITDLATLQELITQVSEEMNEGKISMEQAQSVVEQLQQKYVDLTDITNTDIEHTFDVIQEAFDKNSINSYTLPLWAKKMGMILPVGMNIDMTLSQRNTLDDSGANSTVLVYTGSYDIAMQQAQLIAQNAGLLVSKNFQQAQTLAKIGNIDYISGLDVGSLTKGIVYVNHELLETNIDNLLSVSVDQEGTLTLEATKYKD